jgi:hypothetical protein
MFDPAPRPVGIPEKLTTPVAGLYVAVAAPGSPLKLTPESPGGSPSVYVTPEAVDGPAFPYATVPFTVLPAAAVGGTETDVVTSASGEIPVVPVAVSGSVFGPWLVDVPIPLLAVTDPLAGAV